MTHSHKEEGEEQMSVGVNLLACDKGAHVRSCHDEAAIEKQEEQIGIGVNMLDYDTAVHTRSRYDAIAGTGEKQMSIDVNRLNGDTLHKQSSQTANEKVQQERIDVNKLDCGIAFRKHSPVDTAGAVGVKQMGIGVNKMACADTYGAIDDNFRAVLLLVQLGLEESDLMRALTQLPAAWLRGACTARKLCSRGGREALAKRLAADGRQPTGCAGSLRACALAYVRALLCVASCDCGTQAACAFMAASCHDRRLATGKKPNTLVYTSLALSFWTLKLQSSK